MTAGNHQLEISMEMFVKSEIQNGVGRITLSRPDKRNALKRDFIEQLKHAVLDLKSKPGLRVLRFEAEGTVFCAGMDLDEMQQRAKSLDGKTEWQKDSLVYCELLKEIYSLSVPTVVVLQGPVLAGGVGIVLACDLIVASEASFFMLPEPMRGITAAMVTPLLVYRIGAGAAGHLLLSGERMSAQRAFQLGLCYDVVSSDELAARVEALTKSILTGSQAALSISKQHLANCSNEHLADQIDRSVKISAEARETNDAREGLAAFLEKRQPAWQPD